MQLTEKQINAWIKKAPKLITKTLRNNSYDLDLKELPYDAVGMNIRLKEYMEVVSSKRIGEDLIIVFELNGLGLAVLKVQEDLYLIYTNWNQGKFLSNSENLKRLIRKHVELHGSYKRLTLV